MFSGRVVGIYTAPSAAAPMVPHVDALAVSGRGLTGDRYAAGTGTYSGQGRVPRDVTLVEREAVAAASTEYCVEIGEHETRRNLVTEGVPLNHLVDRYFRVGEVLMRGTRLAEPCAHLERLTRPGVRIPLVHRGGLHATVLTDGPIRLGDVVEPAGPPSD